MKEFLKPYRNHLFALIIFNLSFQTYNLAKQSETIFWWIVLIVLLINGIYWLLRVFKIIDGKDLAMNKEERTDFDLPFMKIH